jgi:hypothetical protein
LEVHFLRVHQNPRINHRPAEADSKLNRLFAAANLHFFTQNSSVPTATFTAIAPQPPMRTANGSQQHRHNYQ